MKLLNFLENPLAIQANKKCIGCFDKAMPFDTKKILEVCDKIRKVADIVNATCHENLKRQLQQIPPTADEQLKHSNQIIETYQKEFPSDTFKNSLQPLKNKAIEHFKKSDQLADKEKRLANVDFEASFSDEVFQQGKLEVTRILVELTGLTEAGYFGMLDGTIPIVFPYDCVFNLLKDLRTNRIESFEAFKIAAKKVKFLIDNEE